MDFAQTNWVTVGMVNIAIGMIVFLAFAWRRQWSIGALLVGLIHLPIAFVNCAAPFRGFLDPNYVGYNFGLIHANPGIEVGIFALSMLLGGLACACILVLDRPGPRNFFVVAFDAFVLLLMVPATLGKATDMGLGSFRVEFGEYLQFGGMPAMLFELGLLGVPMIIGIAWALRRARG